MTIDDLEITEGSANGISVCLYDFDAETLYDTCCFDMNYDIKDKQYEWTFKTPEKKRDIQLLIYAGRRGKTKEIGLKCTGITLEKLE